MSANSPAGYYEDLGSIVKEGKDGASKRTERTQKSHSESGH